MMSKMLGLIVPAGEIDEEKGMDAAEKYLSVNMQFQMSAWLLHLLGDTFSFGMFKSLKDLPNAISWSFGLGWLSWLVMGTPFQVSIVKPMEWRFNRQLRPSRMNMTQLMEAFRKGLIGGPQWNNEMEALGWRDSDKQILHDLAIKDYPDSILRKGLLSGFFTEAQVATELNRKGYLAGRANNIIAYWKQERKIDILEDFTKEYEGLFLDDKVTEGDLRAQYRELNYDNQEINALIQIAELRKIKARSLTIGNIKTAHDKGIIGVAKARQMLSNRGFTPEDVDILIRSWKYVKPAVEVEVPPEEARVLSRSELSAAFKKGVIGASEFDAGLVKLGYSEHDRGIIIKTATDEAIVEAEEVRVQEVVKEEEKTREVTKAELEKAYLEDILSEAQFRDELKVLKYSDKAIDLIVAIAETRRKRVAVEVLPLEKELSKAEFQRAYLDKVIDISRLTAELVSLGYSSSAVAISVESVERKWLENEEKELSEETIALRVDIQKAYIDGKVTAENAEKLLMDEGYTKEGVRIILKYAHESI